MSHCIAWRIITVLFALWLTNGAIAQSDPELFAEGRIALDKYKDCKGAETPLSKVSEAGRQNPVWMSYIARTEECLGNLSSALKHYEDYNKAIPGQIDIINKIGELRYKVRILNQKIASRDEAVRSAEEDLPRIFREIASALTPYAGVPEGGGWAGFSNVIKLPASPTCDYAITYIQEKHQSERGKHGFDSYDLIKTDAVIKLGTGSLYVSTAPTGAPPYPNLSLGSPGSTDDQHKVSNFQPHWGDKQPNNREEDHSGSGIGISMPGMDPESGRHVEQLFRAADNACKALRSQ